MSTRADLAKQVSSNALSAVTYLDGSGWQYVGHTEQEALWRRRDRDAEWEIVLPIDPTLVDAPRRTGELLDVLSQIEQRDVEEIANDIIFSGNDVIRFRTESESPTGSAPLSEAIKILEGCYLAVEAAASTVNRPRAVLGPRKPHDATNYAQSVNVATEPGSFVVALAAPIPAIMRGPIAELAEEIHHGMLFDSRVPFERQANLRLLEAVRFAADLGVSLAEAWPNRLDSEPAVQHGVSANLLEALVKIGTVQEEGGKALGPVLRPFTVTARWAYSRATPPGTPSAITIDRQAIGNLQRMARSFRLQSPQPDTEVSGELVGNMDRREEGGGIATVRTFIAVKENEPPRWRNVQVKLEGIRYELALQAHADHLPVRMAGDLKTSGRLEMTEVSLFEIVIDEDEVEYAEEDGN